MRLLTEWRGEGEAGPCGSGQMVPTGCDKQQAFIYSLSKKTSHLNSNQNPN